MIRRYVFLVLILACGVLHSMEPPPEKRLGPASVKREQLNRPTKQLFAAIEDGDLNQARLALDAGAHVNAFDERAKTPLIHALDKANEAIARLLIARGADINLVHNEFYCTSPIYHAPTSRLIRFMLEKGARITIPKTVGAHEERFLYAAATGDLIGIQKLYKNIHILMFRTPGVQLH